VLLKGIGEKSVANDVKHVLEMVLYCFFPLIYMNFILDCHNKPRTRFLPAWNSNIHYLSKIEVWFGLEPLYICYKYHLIPVLVVVHLNLL
jgi:hypothetical protein